MNAVEIEEAVSNLAAAPFDAAEFPYAFLEAFGNKETTLKRLRSGNSNKSDCGGVLQRGNIHIKACAPGQVPEALAALRRSPATASQKTKFILATDGHEVQAEHLAGDVPPLACEYKDFPNHFAYFLPLAGITTVRQISENAFDIRATGRLNRLYVEILRHNPDWDTAARRDELNHFFARLIFCFFAEDTGIFDEASLFTRTVETMSDRDGSNVHEILSELFRAMNTPEDEREAARLRNWARDFPLVNGNLFSGSVECPKFSRTARNYLLFVGGLDWKLINPDIFGSMIQAVADDEERGALGMHYTSVPNILKVLNPLFLDDLRRKLDEAGDGKTPASKGQLKRLRDRLARIRVFDPACGSGNFLVIAYKEMRQIEAVINERRGERELPSVVPSTNFRGIELRSFAAEIARLALIIAKFQCDALHISQKFACQQVLPLDKDNWITCGNALRLDWLKICPPSGTGVKVAGDDLFNTPKDQAEVDFANAGGETYICGNPPYVGSTWQSAEQKSDVKAIFESRVKSWKSLDYVTCWFMKAVEFGLAAPATSAFVATNSICQGQHVPILWPVIFGERYEIVFAHTSFKWANLANHNAGVTVVIVGISNQARVPKRIFSTNEAGAVSVMDAGSINAYLTNGPSVIVMPLTKPLGDRGRMEWGNKPTDGGHLFLSTRERDELIGVNKNSVEFIKRFIGAQEFINGDQRYCLWIEDEDRAEAEAIPVIATRIEAVAKMRAESKAAETRPASAFPHRFRQIQSVAKERSIVVARVSSEQREFLPVGLESVDTIIGDRNFAIYDAQLWNLSIVASRLHWAWIATVCVRLEMRFSYSNTLGWNTFPVPALSEQNKADLTRCAEEILLAREAHFPATIADLYDPEAMPADLRAAHDRNDETLERIYIGRRFKNDTERLEKLFELYTQMTAGTAEKKKPAKSATKQPRTRPPRKRGGSRDQPT